MKIQTIAYLKKRQINNMKSLLIETRPFSISPVALTEGKSVNGNPLVEGILATCEVKNGNGRYYAKDLYDLFYEGNEPDLDPPGLFDYSKGTFSAMTYTASTQVWDSAGNALIQSGYAAGTYRKVIMALSGFQSAGQGQLIGPDGNEQDTEAFLASLQVLPITNATANGFSGVSSPVLFRVVTQVYGKGIVQYGGQSTTTFPSTGNGGSYNNVCDANGVIYLEADLQVPCEVTSTSLDGYSGYTTNYVSK